MVNYKELGLVNTRDMFARAIKGGYAIPAFNFNNLEQLRAIIKASSELKSPVILQVSRAHALTLTRHSSAIWLRALLSTLRSLAASIHEIVLHLDHGDSFELCKSCVDLGFSSVMIDGSSLPYEENIALTKKVVEYAHQFDVTVEGELGVLAGVEDEVSSDVCHYTKTSRKLSTSQAAQVLTHWQFQSVLLTVLTSLHRSSDTRPEDRQARSSSIGIRRPRRDHGEAPLASQSFSTVLLLYHRSMLILSTSTVASCPMLLVFPESSSQKF